MAIYIYIDAYLIIMHVCSASLFCAHTCRMRVASPYWCKTGEPSKKFYCWMPWNKMALEIGKCGTCSVRLCMYNDLHVDCVCMCVCVQYGYFSL